MMDMTERTQEKEKQKTAVAVAYQPGDVAPKILAAGKGEVAERIIEAAKENEVPFYQDHALADTLAKLEIGQHVPPSSMRLWRRFWCLWMIWTR